MLTEEGQLYTVGCAEQGRLGRIAELFVGRGGRRGLALPLSADLVHTKNKRVAFAGDQMVFFYFWSGFVIVWHCLLNPKHFLE